MNALYNEVDEYAAAWIRNLIAAGHIAPGVVDERSIVELDPEYCARFMQCHFFAGIGCWSYALRLAGWPDDRPVWTGSCPCQPFSAAGKRAGHEDERHLWPAWFRLIGECHPDVVLGEQVSGADGRAWIDVVSTDLEGCGYAVGALAATAAGVGAPHIRQRMYFVADAISARARRYAGDGTAEEAALHRSRNTDGRATGDALVSCGPTGALADDAEPGRRAQPQRSAGAHGRQAQELGRLRDACRLADDDETGFCRQPEPRLRWTGVHDADGRGPDDDAAGGSFWRNVEWIPCRDGKARPTQPGLQPLAHGSASRVGRLRAYGNAIVAPQAAEFIASYLDVRRIA